MKQILLSKMKMLMVGLTLLATGCTTVVYTPGPAGRPGDAYFGIDYTWRAPYSYWDNNPALPENPPIGVQFFSHPGVYEFEYFINRWEYWYGTYEIWVNPGGPGGPHGEIGLDGADNSFTLFCDPDGFWAEVYSWKNKNSNEPIVIERNDSKMNMRITLQKADVRNRAAHPPKWKTVTQTESIALQ